METLSKEMETDKPCTALSPVSSSLIRQLLRQLDNAAEGRFTDEERRHLVTRLKEAARRVPERNPHGLPHFLITLQTALLFAESVEPDHNLLAAILLYPLATHIPEINEDIRNDWGDDVASLISGFEKVDSFGDRCGITNADNYRGLMLSLAEDIRVIIVMIVRQVVLMRMINHHPDEQWVRDVAFQADCLYAQLAHRLGLYKLKSELEDLALKYTNREIYSQIASKLNETKRDRDAYIREFIEPLRLKLEEAGLTFSIKGRTKSISSIWAKIKKQKVDLQHIYDLFAIRVIIDTPREREKHDCWLAYSILADMYPANPARMKDWITIPKSNGYESLHATVMGPEHKWVEVQFRTRRMDLVAEKGLAAHWRYKGVKGDNTDQWMNNIRDILETAEGGPMQLMKDLKPDGLEKKEVFAFTPKGDLFRLQQGASVLDFAFAIHTRVGCQCTGAIVNGAHRKLNYRICNGDTVEIVTSGNQAPRHDWLSIVVTSKARNKIRQSLNEQKMHRAELGKELLERRAKNRKLEIDETILLRLIKKQGYKYINDFFADLADEKVDAMRFISLYQDAVEAKPEEAVTVSAQNFHITESEEKEAGATDVLVIGDKNIRGLKYKFARCCSPVYGDDVFGFISSDGMVKVHKADCPNAPNILGRYPYRIIKVNWSGTTGELMPAAIRIVGHDDIGIVTNITSIIAKEPNMNLRNISIDSHDGVFQGILVIGVTEGQQIERLIRKLKTVKGVKDVARQ